MDQCIWVWAKVQESLLSFLMSKVPCNFTPESTFFLDTLKVINTTSGFESILQIKKSRAKKIYSFNLIIAFLWLYILIEVYSFMFWVQKFALLYATYVVLRMNLVKSYEIIFTKFL